ncbi:MAG: HD domain-containing protein [Anaerovoracaceae bacterium]|jgi:guanosine-3',5'-bis(diphosphate) 3'-pyrophosphohydrolase
MWKEETDNIDTEILDKAIIFATNAHENIPRKCTTIPYILHPMEVAAIVATMTTDIEIIAAAVLHDTVEDNETISFEDIEREFGHRIRRLVEAESEEKEDDPIGSWNRRKGSTVEFLKSNRATEDERILALGDKLSNIRAIYKDYLTVGDEIWTRFNQTDKERQGWYYKEIARALSSLSKYPAYEEYLRLVTKVFGDMDLEGDS